MMLTHICRYHRSLMAFCLNSHLVLNGSQIVYSIKSIPCTQHFVFVRKLHSLLKTCRVTIGANIRNFADKVDEKEEQRIVKQREEFAKPPVRNKNTFLAIVDRFKDGNRSRYGQVEFVTAAVRSMDDYGVQRDLECYKKVLDVFPKGVMVPTNYLQAGMMHFPRHQWCAMELLDKMADNGICPDLEMQRLFKSIFGKYTNASRKFGRMMYWMPKFKNLSPFPLPDPLPNDILELATLAIRRISSVDLQAQISVFKTENLADSLDKTWIVSSQSPKQKELLEEHEKEQALYVEGPFIVWLRKVSVSYFVLRANPKIFPELEEDKDDVSNLVENILNPLQRREVVKRPSVHEQGDGVIMALCATGTSSRDSVLSWVRFLRQDSPVLDSLSVLFTLRAPSKDLVTLNDTRKVQEEEAEEVDSLEEKTQPAT